MSPPAHTQGTCATTNESVRLSDTFTKHNKTKQKTSDAHKHEQAGVFLSGPGLRQAVTSPAEALRLVSKGDAVRATAATDCNEHSSRSHSILSFHVESQRADQGSSSGSGASGVGEHGKGTAGKASGGVRLGKLHLVDLAGRYDIEGFKGVLGTMNTWVFTYPPKFCVAMVRSPKLPPNMGGFGTIALLYPIPRFC